MPENRQRSALGTAWRLLLAVVALAPTGCSVSHLDLVNDHRLRFVSPANRAHTHLPVIIRWSRPAFTGRGSFALFVDRAPVRPGQRLDAIASGDPTCDHPPGCDNAAYFSAHQVYSTPAEAFTLSHIDTLSGNRQSQQLHQVTIVLLDSAGRRLGESAWYRFIWLPRAGHA